MSSLLARKRTTILALSLALIAFYLPPTTHQLRVFGILSRPSDALGNTHAHAYRQGESTAEVKLIPGTTYCEDLHLHERSGLLVTACEGEKQDRRGWFPPLGVFDRPPVRGGPRGSIVVVDPQSFTAKTLELRGYDDDVFVTHGIDIINDPSNSNAIYIHAVNHAPAAPSSPASGTSATEPGPHLAASRIEVFHHTLYSSYATHIKTISHPLIRTPNDIFSLSPSELLVTNDHKHKSGFWRHVEDIISHSWGPKTDIVGVRFGLDRGGAEEVEASVALERIHNGNGLGHGPGGEVMIGDAAGGVLHLASLIQSTSPVTTTTDATTNAATNTHPRLQIHTSIPLHSNIDNPSFYSSSDGTKSGYVLAGLSKGAALGPNAKDPAYKHGVIVWYVPLEDGADGADGADSGEREGTHQKRKVGEPKGIFADDGGLISTASAGVIVDRPTTTGGEGVERWLFVTGFMSDSMVAVKVDL